MLGVAVRLYARRPRRGALRFRAAYDKPQVVAIVPVNADASAALDAYLRDHPRLREAPLFPSTTDATTAAQQSLAGQALQER